MDKKEVPSLVQGLPFRLAGLLASHNPAHLSSELYRRRRLLKKMVSTPSLSIAFAEGSLLTNYENQDKRVTTPIPGSYPIDSSKFASKLMGLEKEITKPLVNTSALVIVNEEGRIRSKKPDQWGLVAATRDYDDEDGDDSDEEVEGEDDNQGDDDDDDDNENDDDDDDDEEPGGNGEASDGEDEGEDDEESDEDDDDDEDEDEDEEDDENEEDEEEPPKKKKK
ncbi:hypothetical protein O6H91_01G092600 [Diphasiastrum complanatum]|uniref:Uncharacterized protein n=1 Tax=Diphasiastrum complanatum TaxID=34168 RepID=A0ACC2ETF2_DIPCM|nr:hypothetical protein O6H91_01G092600 [Diphasiastrum complanatum]